MGWSCRPAARSTASTELNGRPVALAPRARRAASGPMASHTSANVNGLATLMIGKRVSASPR